MNEDLPEKDNPEACPRVSVMIPACNARSTILRALDSVVSQTLQPMEIVVVDDGSTDGTARLVEEYSLGLKPGLLRLVRLDCNHGPSHARNVGWDAALGDFVAFLDADDAWHPHKLQAQTEWMTKNPQFVLTAHRVACVRRDEDRPSHDESCHWKRIRPWQLKISSCQFWPSSIMVRTGTKYRFEPSMSYGEDRLFCLQVVLSGHAVAHLDLPLGYRYNAYYGEAGLSQHLWRVEKGELDAFDRLEEMGLLCWSEGVFLKALSLLKYVRRVCVCRMRVRSGAGGYPWLSGAGQGENERPSRLR